MNDYGKKNGNKFNMSISTHWELDFKGSYIFIHYQLLLLLLLRCILDFERSRNQRQGPEFFSREVEFMRWYPVVFLTNGVLKGTHGGIELTTPVL